MRQKAFLLQQLTFAIPWLLIAVALFVGGQLSGSLSVMLLAGLVLTLLSSVLWRGWRRSSKRHRRMLEDMLSSSPLVVWSINREGIVTSFRGRALRLGVLSEANAIGRNALEYFADNSAFVDDLQRTLNGERLTVFRQMGGRYYRHHLRPLVGSDRKIHGVHCISVDLTREQRLIDRIEVAQKIFEHTGDAVVIADSTRRILMVNSAFCDTTLFLSDEVVGLKLGLPPMRGQSLSFYRDIWQTVRMGQIWRGEISARRKDGEAFASHMTLVPVRGRDGQLSHYIAFFADVTALRESQDELRYLANHDSLTGLPNRRLFLDRIDQALRRARRSGSKLAIYFMDLDHFKEVNDNYGHQAGDVMLREVAARLQEIVRESDTVARLAGDEFTIIAEDVSNDDQVIRIAQKILESFAEPFYLDGHTVRVTTSIGIALFPEDGSDSLALLKAADTAMYRAKESGRNCYHMLSQHRYLDELQSTRTDLEEALKQGQLSLVYQPIVSMGEADVVGCEALLRWNHSRHGLLSAGDFISIAEDAGLMLQFGDWVLRTACLQLKSWQKLGHALQVLSVNLSAAQVLDPEFALRVLSTLKEVDLDPACLILEIAEVVVLEHLEETTLLVEFLSVHGIRFSIDDFGTGTSAYSYLKTLPVHLLKIDHRILNEARQHHNNEGFVRAMVILADFMGMEVVAEGVEREPQERFLRELGCSLGQGYFYGRPVSAASFIELLDQAAVQKQSSEPGAALHSTALH